MCGIVGAVGDIEHKMHKVFKDLLQIDILRGPHSTGVVAVEDNGKVSTAKCVGGPVDLFDTKTFETMMYGKKKVLIGHNRYATQGAVNKRNAHPFNHGNITGVHNGTLRRQNLLPESKDFAVDSENIMYAINKEDIFVTVGKLEGAYALAYYDEADTTLNLVRNKERPLFICNVEKSNTIFFASEAWMLFGALTRNGYKPVNIRELPIHELNYCIVDEVGFRFSGEINKEKVEPYVYVPPKVTYPKPVATNVTYVGGQGSLINYVGTSNAFSVTSITSNNWAYFKLKKVPTVLARMYVSPDVREELEDALKNDYDIEARCSMSVWDTVKAVTMLQLTPQSLSVYAPQEVEEIEEGVISELEFNKATKKGCAWCGDPLHYTDREDIKFIGEDEAVCHSCQSLPVVQEYLGEEQ
jgi:predicted glutamine amidotransferase